jgi:ferredoxin
MRKLCEEEGVSLVKFDNRRWRGKFPLSSVLDECDYLVSVPKFKTHDLMILTGAIKNLFGLIPGTYKTELHKRFFKRDDFARILVDIYEETRPAFTLIDAVTAMEGDGPATAGKLRNTGLLLAGSDCVALDSILALIMGIKPLDILSTKEASDRGLGIADTGLIDISGERLKDVISGPFLMPGTAFAMKIPLPILNVVRFYPRAEYGNCTLCGDCVAICPNKAISIKSDKIVFDYSRCISCFCCQEVCPASAIKVKKSILAGMLGL